MWFNVSKALYAEDKALNFSSLINELLNLTVTGPSRELNRPHANLLYGRSKSVYTYLT